MPIERKSKANEIYLIKVTLLGTQIWRRLLVPANITLAYFHHVLQSAMGWYDDHMHEFRIGRQIYGIPNPDPYAFNPRAQDR
jgi:hypothetical protein